MERQFGPRDQNPKPGAAPEEQKLDDVLDRPAGEDHNPNPEDVVAQNRARFDERNRELQQEKAQVAEAWERENERFLQEAEQMAQNAEHQAMQQHQRADRSMTPPVERAGAEEDVSDDTSLGSTYDDPNMRPAEHPGSPIDPDRYLEPPVR